jgi:hypothetical protein
MQQKKLLHDFFLLILFLFKGFFGFSFLLKKEVEGRPGYLIFKLAIQPGNLYRKRK